MSYFITLPTDTEHLDSPHKENIELALLNLEEFNQRFQHEEGKVKIKYNLITSKFETEDKRIEASFITDQINHFLWWKNESDVKVHINTYLSNVIGKYIQDFIRNTKSVGSKPENEIDFYNKRKQQLFNYLYNFYPLGFLEYSETELIRTSVNEMIDNLPPMEVLR